MSAAANLRERRIKNEQDLSLSATANLCGLTESISLYLWVHKRSWIQLSGLYPILLRILVRPKSRSCPFSSSGSETAYTACLFDLRFQKFHQKSCFHKLPVIFPLNYFKNNLGNFGASHWSNTIICLWILYSWFSNQEWAKQRFMAFFLNEEISITLSNTF